MTDAELYALLRPHLARALAEGERRGRAAALADLGRERAATFAADADDSPHFRPAFTAADVGRIGDYFADADGAYPGTLHRHFGMGLRAFAEATGMVRRHTRGADGRGEWHWVRRAAADGPAVDPDAGDEGPEPAFGFTEGGEVWFSEAAYQTFAARDRSHLVKKVITNSRGRQQTVWVRPDTAAGADEKGRRAADPTHQPAAGEHTLARAVRDPAGLTAADLATVAEQLAGLPRERLRQMALAVRQRIGGTRAALADRLLAHLRGAGAGAAGDAPPAPDEPVPMAEPVSPAELAAELDRLIQDDMTVAGSLVRMQLVGSDPDPDSVRAAVAAVRADPSGLTLGPADLAFLARLEGLAGPAPGGARQPASPPPAPAPAPTATPPSAARPTITPGQFRTPANVAVTVPGQNNAQAVNRLFGRAVPPEHLAAMSNAPDGATVSVTRLGSTNKVQAQTRFDGGYATRTFRREPDGSLAVHNDLFFLRWKRKRDGTWERENPAINGTELLTNQVAALRAAGVSKMDTFACRSDDPDPNRAMNGYYTWPRLGYDGPIEEYEYARVHPDIRRQMEAGSATGSRHQRSIQNLMAVKSVALSPAERADTIAKLHEIDRARGKPPRTVTDISGAMWWQAHGWSIHLEFDLADDSLSMRTLNQYLSKNRQE